MPTRELFQEAIDDGLRLHEVHHEAFGQWHEHVLQKGDRISAGSALTLFQTASPSSTAFTSQYGKEMSLVLL